MSEGSTAASSVLPGTASSARSSAAPSPTIPAVVFFFFLYLNPTKQRTVREVASTFAFSGCALHRRDGQTMPASRMSWVWTCSASRYPRGWKDADICARTHGTYVATPIESVASVVPHSAAEQDAIAAPVPAALAQRVPVPRVCRATVQLVERAIVVVRRRRSLKAVETYEQVRFLVDFVEHLDSRAGIDCDVD
ncbi:hypothetical protein DFH11DRAFT_1874284 [Phellopilus nigrolimitatus]|nr:hypothetical protein DFH11DRAFT_1874284 [Phellopilus nigrolimitatus]